MLRRSYKPGDFLRVCDRTGFVQYASRTRKEWTGRIVRDRSFELRHPQDFVKGTVDNPRVPDPRPRQPDVFVTVVVPSYAPAPPPPFVQQPNVILSDFSADFGRKDTGGTPDPASVGP